VHYKDPIPESRPRPEPTQSTAATAVRVYFFS
jgi:hypothetical protein